MAMTFRPTGYLRARPSWVYVGLPAFTMVLGMQSVRVLRDRLKRETELVGALGLAIFASAFLAAPLRRLLGTRVMLIATAGGLGVLRLAMQAWTGDPVGDFILASGGVILFVLFLPTYLSYVQDREEASLSFALGLLLGLALDVTLQGAYATYDLSWDSGVAALLVIAVVAVLQWAFLWGLSGPWNREEEYRCPGGRLGPGLALAGPGPLPVPSDGGLPRTWPAWWH